MAEVLAVIRKEKSYELSRVFSEKGIPYISWTVKGRGKEGGFKYKGMFREKVLIPFLPKKAFLIFTDFPENVVQLILDVANTGNYGDGKIFVIKEGEVSGVKLIKAIVRPDKALDVVKELDSAGFKALTMWDVVGRGKEGGLKAGEATYDELAKTLIMIAVEDKDANKVVETINKAAHTGAYGDGKVFVCELSEVWTVRSKKKEL